jgi:hypothetical protein
MPRPNKSGRIDHHADGAASRTVWRFVDYEGRFGAKEALKQFKAQCVPKYIQWHINAWDGYGGAALLALNRLRAEKDFIWYQGAVVELLTVATNTHPEYQGYLLTSRHEPAQASDVGSMLRVDGRRALVVLTRLILAGFLEKVPWPPSSPAGPIPDDPSLRLLQDVAAASKKGAGKGGGKGHSRGENADDALTKGGRSEMLAAQANIEGTAAAETPPAEGGQAAPQGENAETVKVVCPNCGNTGSVPKVAQGHKVAQCSKCRAIVTYGNPQTSTSMTSTNPDGRVGLANGGVRDASPNAHPPSVIRLQDVRDQGIEPNKYSAAGNAFGIQVCAAWGYVTHDGGEYATEIAHWAALYDDSEHGLMSLTPERQEKVKAKLLRICGIVRTHAQRYENPAAYLERTLQNAIRDARRAKRRRMA